MFKQSHFFYFFLMYLSVSYSDEVVSNNQEALQIDLLQRTDRFVRSDKYSPVDGDWCHGHQTPIHRFAQGMSSLIDRQDGSTIFDWRTSSYEFESRNSVAVATISSEAVLVYFLRPDGRLELVGSLSNKVEWRTRTVEELRSLMKHYDRNNSSVFVRCETPLLS
jgi:hypothetical protein